MRDTSAWPGLLGLFTRTGFSEVARSDGRVLGLPLRQPERDTTPAIA